VASTPFRYQSPDEDSARWLGFPFRDGDIVISTRSKTGTTWVQMICALLIFQTAELPAPLQQLSLWPDGATATREDLLARLEAQQHRRFLKTHLRLGEIPIDPRATYIVVARNPLDAALSFYHHVRVANSENPDHGSLPDPSPREVLLWWMGLRKSPDDTPEDYTMPAMMAHLRDSWEHRNDANVILLHYDDLRRDLAGEMRRLAEQLGITVPETKWPDLVKAATFKEMRAIADQVQPLGEVQDPKKFFRSGTSGGGRQHLSNAELDRYYELVAPLAPPDLVAWAHGEDHGKDKAA
jgi:hypothetical protein